MHQAERILIIQTAFIGDAILASSLVESIHDLFPKARIELLVRKGNETLYAEHPYLERVLVWNKARKKYMALVALLKDIRLAHYDAVINLQRFGATGILTGLSGAPLRVGFKKNPFSFLFSHAVEHAIGDGTHEIERNLKLLTPITNVVLKLPKLYPSKHDEAQIEPYRKQAYITLSPTSVWFTKQWPKERWIKLIETVPRSYTVYMLGGPTDAAACNEILEGVNRSNTLNLAGKLSFLQSAALMKHAKMNYVNDSAPLHLASAVNAPCTAIFCSTIPEFGFGPLSDLSFVIQTAEKLTCRPCGLHGKARCPEGHFKCARNISIDQALSTLSA